uniref:C3H1-type domain-containing protein n=1 Tax=Graphocephala atropunctata TaxID=36148 RepID=A0A1B6LRP1_9HEMI
MGKHAAWRKEAKKLRRKRIRSVLAAARDQKLLIEKEKRERSPTYKTWLEEQALLEEFNAAEEKRLAMERQKQWETQDEAALLRWREQQSRLAQAKAEKFKREIMIKEEWEREQRKLQEAEEVRKKMEDEKKRKQAELLTQIDAFIEGRAELPDEVNVSTQTQPGQPECPFFYKTGACRFRDLCSRNHTRPGISRTLLVPNFYDHFGLQTLNHDEYDTDVGLEYEESETYQHFKSILAAVNGRMTRGWCGRQNTPQLGFLQRRVTRV